MRFHVNLSLAAAVIAVALIPPAGAQPVIDDFETGTFHLVAQAGDFVSGSYSVSSPAHAMAAFRVVGLRSYDGVGLPAYADLDAWTVLDDKVRLAFGPDGGFAFLNYEPLTPVDLTAAGQNDRIEVVFSASTVGGHVRLFIRDILGSSALHTLNTSGGAHVFPFLLLSGLDLTRVAELSVTITHPSWGSYDLRDIRAMRRDAFSVKFDVPVETVVGPPFPAPPLRFTVTDMMPSDLQEVTLLNATRIATGAAAGLALTGMDSGGDTEAGFAGAVSVSWNESGRPFESTAFNLQVDVAALSGVEPQPFLPALPAISATPTGFLLEFEVHFPSDQGQVVRTSKRLMPFDVFPGQGLSLAEARVYSPDPTRPAGTPGFRVTFNAVSAGGVDPGEPLFEMTFTGDCRLATTSGTPGLDAAKGVQALRARPTVTRAGAELFLAHPAGAAGRIDLFDATGRLVRSLDVPRGGGGRFWDGRDSGGHPTAAGVFFARFSDGKQDLQARIVRVR